MGQSKELGHIPQKIKMFIAIKKVGLIQKISYKGFGKSYNYLYKTWTLQRSQASRHFAQIDKIW